MSLLQLLDLTKNFDGLRAVDGFSLDIPEGSLNALVGPNGCGKSTLFNLITGVLKPDAGQVIFRDQEITGWPPHRIARLGIGRKFQVPAIFEEMTVRENLTVAAKRSGNRVSIDTILDQIKLADRRDTSGGELAHGQKQWLEIGLLLAQTPSLILLDEPTAGMTGAETKATADLIRTINQDQGITVLVIEHDMGFIEYLGCPLNVMSKGKILKSGNFTDIRNDAEVKALYFGNTAVPADA